MEKAKAELSFDLMIDCPECGHNFDLMSSPYDDDGEISIPIFNNKWGDLRNKSVWCPECNKQFKIEEVYY